MGSGDSGICIFPNSHSLLPAYYLSTNNSSAFQSEKGKIGLGL